MARYDVYVDKIECQLNNGLVMFYFSDGGSMLMDRGELGAALKAWGLYGEAFKV